MSKICLVDVGEFGWSLYLYARHNWLKDQGHDVIVMTSPDRSAMYENTIPVPQEFYDIYGKAPNDCFGKRGVSTGQVIKLISKYIPEGYEIGNRGFKLERFDSKEMTYRPVTPKKRILVFPRYRSVWPFSQRNLPKLFYIDLIKNLCDRFPQYIITSFGNHESYIIENKLIKSDNYLNAASDNNTIDNFFIYAQNTVASVGGTSSLPKLAMLQGIPSYIIGHEKERFTVIENPTNEKVGFWEIKLEEYNNFNSRECVVKIEDFIECQHR